MTETRITADELLAGSSLTFEVVVPANILHPGENGKATEGDQNRETVVQLRPLTIGAFQLIMKAAKSDAGHIPLLMIKEALVQPALSLEQVKQMHLGLVNFLIEHIRQISGLMEKKSPSHF